MNSTPLPANLATILRENYSATPSTAPALQGKDLSDDAFAATAKPPRMTPWQKKEDRLVRQLAKTEGEIGAAGEKYRAVIMAFEQRKRAEIDAAAENAVAAADASNSAAARLAACRDRIAAVQEELRVLIGRLPELQGAASSLQHDAETAAAHSLAVRGRWAATKPPEGAAHLAALHKDRDGVAYRLQQHRARMARS